jgi:hypothetical protein
MLMCVLGIDFACFYEFLKYNTVGTVLKYNTVGTVLKYNTVRTVLKYNTVGTVLKYNTVFTNLLLYLKTVSTGGIFLFDFKIVPTVWYFSFRF